MVQEEEEEDGRKQKRGKEGARKESQDEKMVLARSVGREWPRSATWKGKERL